MRTRPNILPTLFFICFHCCCHCMAQDTANHPSMAAKLWKGIQQTPGMDSALATLSPATLKKYLTTTENKTQELASKLKKANTNALKDLSKQEQRLRKKLFAKDSSLAKQLFDKPSLQYQQLAAKLQSKTSSGREYLPFLDTLKTSLKFLNNRSVGEGVGKSVGEEAAKALGSVKGLEAELQKTTDIKKYLKQRKQELKDAFEKNGIGKELTRLNKQAYYYQAQVQEYKNLLKDRKKAEEKAVAELRKLAPFKDFMKNNSQLASLFKVPDNYGTPQALAGLQTRAGVNQLLQARLGSLSSTPSPTADRSGAGGGGGAYLQQQVQAAQTELNKLKEKAAKLGSGSFGDAGDMPNFTPNTQKTKSFLKRLEYGFNLQSQRPNGLLPVTSDIAATVGYKLNDKATIGTGLSYKLGWGNGFKEVRLTNQGLGLRTYFEWKIPPLMGNGAGSFWLTGGYEKNYTPELGEKLAALNLQGIKATSWQSSGLVGLTKKIKVGKHTSNIQLLYDFLASKQVPKTQELKFRVGWVL